ncbi:cytochrome c oxidase assembly protein [Nitratireductor sp. GISD-1A_MAKvit]|uniref:cytochrome c oxidase assembly protein n=1 Tax=Nitratireductor sp. GISD-1A_MAKvit TaxID=3234198 RepID=UPI0034679FFE
MRCSSPVSCQWRTNQTGLPFHFFTNGTPSGTKSEAKHSECMGHMLSSHMAIHIAAMNGLAPLAVWLLPARLRSRISVPIGLFAATVIQLALLWGWHAPFAMQWAGTSSVPSALMHLTLFLSALAFWDAVFSDARSRPWNALLALLVTGKLFCLLGVLLVFSPRALYAAPLGDQQLAGLLMLIACPATYVLGSIILVRDWYARTEIAGGWHFPEGER